MFTMITSFMLSTAFAQDGNNIFAFDATSDLPTSGDIGVGFNATPILDFGLNMVNIMNNTGQTAAGLSDWPTGASQTLSVKYFLSDTTAARVKVGINRGSSTVNTLYTDPVEAADPSNNSPSEISDTINSSETLFLLSGGYEMRRGYNRIQGFYGGEALLGMASSSSSTSYGWRYDTDAFDNGVIGDGSSRVLQEKSGMGLSVGLRGFVGVEYFIAPKISLGSEYGWAMSVGKQGSGSSTVETWSVDSNGDGSRDTESNKTGSSSSARVGHDNGIDQFYTGGTGAVTLNIYF